MLDAARHLAYVFHPILADEPRRAGFWRDTDLEIAEPPPDLGTPRYAMFDNDGTLSTLRQGWEPVMIRAVLGDR